MYHKTKTMRAVIQRVKRASVTIENKLFSEINHGLLILLGIETADNDEDIEWLSKKISQLRIFNDSNSVMNLDVREVKGSMIVVSQFTLHAKTKKGNRPSYINAAVPDIAIPLYEKFVKQLQLDSAVPVKTGQFGAMMDVELVNHGPVTLLIESRKMF